MKTFSDFILQVENEERDIEAIALLYKAARIMCDYKPEALMGFLEANGNNDVVDLIQKIKVRKGGLNIGTKGLADKNDHETIRTHDSDRGGDGEQEGMSGEEG